MKKLFTSSLVLGLMLASCSSEEPSRINGDKIDNQITNYLTVNLIPTGSPSTRADGAPGESDHDGGEGGKYENGNPSEQQVNSIRFFFFDDQKNAAPVSVVTQDNDAVNVSYIDWTHYDSDLGPGKPNETVEATITATLGLTIPDGYKNPTSLIAVINPNDTVLNLTGDPGSFGPTMSEVQSTVGNFEAGLTDGNFVMSNSVYVNTAGATRQVVNYTDLTVDTENGEIPYFQASIEAAQANPVTVYVERVAARLDLKIGLQATANGYYPVMKKVDGGQDIQFKLDLNGDGNEEPIYVNFLGWNVTSTPDKSFLIKNVNPNWTSAQLFGESNLLWNSMDYHRSFWALNPNNVGYMYGNFGLESGKNEPNNFQPAQANDMPESGEFATTYMMGNASPFTGTELAPKNPTQVIIAAQLVTENGDPVPLAEWGYKKYTQEGLLNYLVANIISKGKYYKLDGGSYKTLQPDDLEFVSAAQYYSPNPVPENVKSYYSYIIVNTTPETQWYQWNGEGDAPTADTLTPVDTDAIDTFIKDNVGYTLMWNSGYSYYYFDVHHLGMVGSPAYYGVVRNHIYQATVKTLYGFGTPVCNPDEIIIPEAPDYEEVLLAAEIKILQWRVVSADYTLNWR